MLPRADFGADPQTQSLRVNMLGHESRAGGREDPRRGDRRNTKLARRRSSRRVGVGKVLSQKLGADVKYQDEAEEETFVTHGHKRSSDALMLTFPAGSRKLSAANSSGSRAS